MSQVPGNCCSGDLSLLLTFLEAKMWNSVWMLGASAIDKNMSLGNF